MFCMFSVTLEVDYNTADKEKPINRSQLNKTKTHNNEFSNAG